MEGECGLDWRVPAAVRPCEPGTRRPPFWCISSEFAPVPPWRISLRPVARVAQTHSPHMRCHHVSTPRWANIDSARRANAFVQWACTRACGTASSCAPRPCACAARARARFCARAPRGGRQASPPRPARRRAPCRRGITAPPTSDVERPSEPIRGRDPAARSSAEESSIESSRRRASSSQKLPPVRAAARVSGTAGQILRVCSARVRPARRAASIGARAHRAARSPGEALFKSLWHGHRRRRARPGRAAAPCPAPVLSACVNRMRCAPRRLLLPPNLSVPSSSAAIEVRGRKFHSNFRGRTASLNPEKKTKKNC